MSEIKTGVHDMAEADYHADPAPEPSLSSSIIKVLLKQTPRHAWLQHPRLNPAYEAVDQRKFDMGTAAHALLLQGENIIEIIDADSFRTKAAKVARDAAYAAGKIPLFKSEAGRVFAMRAAALAQLKAHEEGRFFLLPSKSEQTLVWQDEQGFWCRARLDRLVAIRRTNHGFIWDYKTTTSANPDDWQGRLFDLGFDIQATWYMRGVRALGILPAFRFIVQETTPPYALSVIGLTPETLAMAEVKIEHALGLWRWCIAHDRWPGYSNQTCYLEPPAWELAKFEEMKVRDELARERPLLSTMMEWQAPHEDAVEQEKGE